MPAVSIQHSDGYGDGGQASTKQDAGKETPERKKDPTDEFYLDDNITARDLDREEKLFGGQHSKGINFEKYSAISVEVKGNSVPQPIASFADSPLHPLLKSNVKLAGYSKPTPVQQHAIAIVNAGRDLIASAQTGSGKTAAFLFPILSKAFHDGPSMIHTEEFEREAHVAYPSTLILAPTRELAVQIHQEVLKFTYRSWIKSCVAFGGQPIEVQIRRLEKGCDLIVATPGRLVDLIDRGCVVVKNIKYLVLDEADRMLDMGFGYQVRRIVGEEDMHKNRQTLMFSATFPPSIANIASLYLFDYLFLTIGRIGSTSQNISQQVIQIDTLPNKKSALLELLANETTKISGSSSSTSSNNNNSTNHPKPNLTLIFVHSKKFADELTHYLLANNFEANSIHGGRLQQERDAAISDFKQGLVPILVATDIASRGLDIPNVNHVINFDMPREIDDYVHRIGRTGRAGNMGKATSFFSLGGRDEALSDGLIKVLKEAKQPVPKFLMMIKK
ncbi:P-loop containing nucleoside triphosphate hydrolase protein [Obelidium mucronatum]|nr:P-loop containing nucleoside triphosphate hydrolase protein [Obelidium mucronatum]